MKISSILAQEIVDKVMEVIPYNVNIMDDSGVIIGSGNKERIGSYHEGAISAINEKNMVSIHKTEGASKPGVNIPIHFQNKIIGVIGISGDPKIVSPFAELVRVTANLLINQEFLFRERRIKEKMEEEFLNQWVFRNDEYDADFFNRAEAIKVNLKLMRKAVIVQGIISKKPLLSDQEFILNLNQDCLLFIVPESSNILSRLEWIITSGEERIGIGTSHRILAKSVHEAKRAIEISEKLKLTNAYCDYNQLKFIDYLANKDVDFNGINQIYQQLGENPKGQELLKTLLCYIENSGEMNAVSNELHIHRNSLAYRLQKIEILTNKNPRNFIDLFQLFTGYILYKMNEGVPKS